MPRKILTALLALTVLAWIGGCDDDDDCPNCPPVDDPTVADLLETSLHNTTNGMEYFYSAANGGFEQITGVPYQELSCKNCHVDPADGEMACEACHGTTAAVGRQLEQSCLSVCHSRQAVERQLYAADGGDIHANAGMTCDKCHDARDVHGEGDTPDSMLEDGVILAKCENCHNAQSNSAHDQHVLAAEGTKLDCSVCHTRGVISCFSCHFETEINDDMKVFPKPPVKGWKFLVNRPDGKVHTANVMGLTYDGNTFYVVAPYYPHTVYIPQGDQCAECHNNAFAQDYAALQPGEKMKLLEWDPNGGPLGTGGYVPLYTTIMVPENYADVFDFDFVTTSNPLDAAPTWSVVDDPDGAMSQDFPEFWSPLADMPPQFGGRED